MPTYSRSDSFKRDYRALNARQKTKFRSALLAFVDDLSQMEAGLASGFRPALRVKPMQNNPGVWEMTFELSDGRATFTYGETVVEGKRHIEWRRCGTHAIFTAP